ncbi:hypothetical protein AGMMS50262_20820 [Bacteroidia bacterium]|nr:hypothetical protein AGMMS50262_20820 [Bacteroidia bacterium]
MLFISLCACTKKQEKVEIPAILQNHPEKALFTKLNDTSNKPLILFNGKDLSGWYTYTDKYGKDNDVDQQFLITDSTLYFAGEPMGYLATNGSYKDYYLKVVFRWGEKKYPPRLDSPRDSGILYHFSEDATDTVWPVSFECQVQENDCGDYFLIGGVTADSPNRLPDSGNRFIRTANYENPNPEWNTIEVICWDNRSEHYVNGHLVNQASDLSVSEGRILLQTEAAEVYYKSVELLQLK